MAAIMLVMCIFIVLGAPHGGMGPRDMHGNTETPSVQVDRTGNAQAERQ